MKSIYLDFAAASPMDKEVFLAMKPYLADNFYNPASQYLAAKSVRKDIEKARSGIAHWLGVRPVELVFTAGGTEANNLAVNGVMQRFPGANIVLSSIEHEAVSKPASRYDTVTVDVDKDGLVYLEKLKKAINDQTVMVSIMYANNEVGTVQSMKKIAEIIKSVLQSRKNIGNDLPLYFHTDACQAAAYLDLHANTLGVDMMTINAGKIYGPKQSGALYVRAGLAILPQVLGGGQELGLRSGTENVANIVGFAKALDLVQTRRIKEVKRMSKLQSTFIELLERAIPTVTINGSKKHRLPNNVHITVPGTDNELLMMQLDEAGVQCAVGSACSASNDEPSHVLKAIGLSDEAARSSLRFSMGFQTTELEVRKTVLLLEKILNNSGYFGDKSQPK